MSHHHEAEAAVRTMGGLGVRAVRLLYTDLHGVARGKDIPIGHFGGMCEEGVAFCAAVMGTDLQPSAALTPLSPDGIPPEFLDEPKHSVEQHDG